MGFCDPTGDGQSKSYASLGAASALVNTVETVEEIGKMFSANTNAGVLDSQLRLTPVHLRSNIHLPARGSVLDCVVKEVEHKLQQQVFVGLYRDRRTIVKPKPHTLIKSHGTDLLHHSGHEFSNIHFV